MNERTIDITNTGPIGHVSIPVPSDGGVVVLRGGNGSGKSTAIDAVNALTREGRITPKARVRDGQLAGAVEGLGRRIKIGLQRNAVLGELEVDAISDDVDVAKLVDPGLKDPEAADRARVKAALLLARIGVDVRPFAELLGSEDALRQFCRAESLAATDPVEMATKIRADLHGAALVREREAAQRETQSATIRETIDEDVASGLNGEAARSEHQAAVMARSELTTRAARAAEAAKQRATAERAIAECREGITVADAEEGVRAARANTVLLEGEVERARNVLAEAQRQLAVAKEQERSCVAQLDASKKLAETIARAKQALAEIRDVQAPSAEEYSAADRRVTDATNALGVALRAEAAGIRLAEANRYAEEAAQARADAEALRQAARGTDGVLAEMLARVAPAGLTISDARLVLTLPDGSRKFYAELSDGERWKIALDLAIDALGDARVLAISQLAWEGLDIDARREIDEHARRRQTVIVTAEADHDVVRELRAETFGGGA